MNPEKMEPQPLANDIDLHPVRFLARPASLQLLPNGGALRAAGSLHHQAVSPAGSTGKRPSVVEEMELRQRQNMDRKLKDLQQRSASAFVASGRSGDKPAVKAPNDEMPTIVDYRRRANCPSLPKPAPRRDCGYQAVTPAAAFLHTGTASAGMPTFSRRFESTGYGGGPLKSCRSWTCLNKSEDGRSISVFSSHDPGRYGSSSTAGSGLDGSTEWRDVDWSVKQPQFLPSSSDVVAVGPLSRPSTAEEKFPNGRDFREIGGKTADVNLKDYSILSAKQEKTRPKVAPKPKTHKDLTGNDEKSAPTTSGFQAVITSVSAAETAASPNNTNKSSKNKNKAAGAVYVSDGPHGNTFEGDSEAGIEDKTYRSHTYRSIAPAEASSLSTTTTTTQLYTPTKQPRFNRNTPQEEATRLGGFQPEQKDWIRTSPDPSCRSEQLRSSYLNGTGPENAINESKSFETHLDVYTNQCDLVIPGLSDEVLSDSRDPVGFEARHPHGYSPSLNAAHSCSHQKMDSVLSDCYTVDSGLGKSEAVESLYQDSSDELDLSTSGRGTRCFSRDELDTELANFEISHGYGYLVSQDQKGSLLQSNEDTEFTSQEMRKDTKRNATNLDTNKDDVSDLVLKRKSKDHTYSSESDPNAESLSIRNREGTVNHLRKPEPEVNTTRKTSRTGKQTELEPQMITREPEMIKIPEPEMIMARQTLRTGRKMKPEIEMIIREPEVIKLEQGMIKPDPEVTTRSPPDQSKDGKTGSGKVEIDGWLEMEVELMKGAIGLGFCIEGGVGSPNGDRSISVKRLFRGETAAAGKLEAGDVILRINGLSLVDQSHFQAWNLLKSLPEGPVQLTIRRQRN